MKFSLQVLLVLGLVSCRESFPDIYMEFEEGAPSPYPQNGETGLVPIIPSFIDPMYDIYTRSGYGQFKGRTYEDDREHWDNAEFHTFALLASNSYSGGDPVRYPSYPPDYTVPSNGNNDPQCLLWNQTMKMKGGSEDNLYFVDKFEDGKQQRETKYYSWQYQNYKYNFFTYYADNAVTSAPQTSGNTVKTEVTIDGSQDVIHAFAYHTDEDIDDWITRRKNAGGFTEQDKPLVDDLDQHSYGEYDYLYSTMAGHRGMHPYFHAHHLLTALRFQIRGVKSSSGTMIEGGGDGDDEKRKLPEEYQQIVVRRIVVETPNKGWLTIANDAWTNPDVYEDDINNNRVLTFGSKIEDLDVIMDKVPATDYFPWLLNDPYYKYGENDAQWHVNREQAKDVGMAIMIPPCDSVRVRLETDLLNIAADGEHLSTDITSLNPVYYNLKYANGPFEAGHEYTIIINVYGAKQIQGSLQLDGWCGSGDDIESGGDGSGGNHQVEVGEDDEEYE